MLRQSGRLYPSDLSNQQWKSIRRLIPQARAGGRPRKTSVRQVINAIFYLSRSGCAWRYLPCSFPPWQTVYDYFAEWKRLGVWTRIHEVLRNRVRVLHGRPEAPRCVIIDSQTIKAPRGEQRAWDGFKKIRGRKRQTLVDTLGMVQAVRVHAADLQDQKEGHHLYRQLSSFKKRRIERILADLGYRGQFVRETHEEFGFDPEIKTRGYTGQGRRKTTEEKKLWRQTRPMLVQPKRWIVERTFGWWDHYRRLAKDYEFKTTSSEAMIYIAMSQLMIRRLEKSKPRTWH